MTVTFSDIVQNLPAVPRMRVIHKGGFFVGSYQIYHFIIAKNVCRCNCSAFFPGVVAQSAQCGQDGPEGQRREGAHDKAQHQHHRRIVQRHGRGQDKPRAKQLADVVGQCAADRRDVATPFPPLNLKNTGKVCPNTTNIPAN